MRQFFASGGQCIGIRYRSNQSILKEISPEYSLEGLTLKLKLQYQAFTSVKRCTPSPRGLALRQGGDVGKVPEGKGHLPALEGWGRSWASQFHFLHVKQAVTKWQVGTWSPGPKIGTAHV